MKIFLFAFLILLCCQSFHASDCSSCKENRCQSGTSSCKEDLAKLEQNASTFFAQLKALHEQGQKAIADTALICVAFFGTQYSFLNLNYASDFNTARCKAHNFVATFPAGSQSEINNIIKVEDSSSGILNLIREFRRNNDLTCRSRLFLKGCEAELNAQRCELSAFLKDISNKGGKVNTLLKGCKDGINTLNKIVESFGSANNLQCDGSSASDADFCKLRKAINAFFVDLNENHWGLIHFKFVTVQFTWDQILAKLSDLNLRYILGC